MKMHEVWDVYLESHINVHNSPGTAISNRYLWERNLKSFFGEMEIDAIRKPQIVLYVGRETKRNVSKKTIDNHLILIRHMLNWSVEMEFMEKAPKILKLGKKKDRVRVGYLEDAEVERIIGALVHEVDKQMARFCLYTGLRLGEMVALRWVNVILDGSAPVIRVIEATSGQNKPIGTPKGGPRDVPIHPNLLPILKEWKLIVQQANCRSQFVFVRDSTPLGHTISTQALHYAMRIARIKTGITRKFGTRLASWHLLRHTFASRLAIRGSSIQKIKGLLGHVDVSTTMQYAHLSPSALADAVKLLD